MRRSEEELRALHMQQERTRRAVLELQALQADASPSLCGEDLDRTVATEEPDTTTPSSSSKAADRTEDATVLPESSSGTPSLHQEAAASPWSPGGPWARPADSVVACLFEEAGGGLASPRRADKAIAFAALHQMAQHIATPELAEQLVGHPAGRLLGPVQAVFSDPRLAGPAAGAARGLADWTLGPLTAAP